MFCAYQSHLYVMNTVRSALLIVFVSLLLASCYEDPDFSDTPRLTDIEVYTKDASNGRDSLIVRVGFEDGDGDLGIGGNENDPFFRIPNPNTNEPYWIYRSNNTDPGLPPYDCERYRFVPLTPGDSVYDTLLVEYNEDYFNYDVTLFTKEDGQYQEYDFIAPPRCSTPLGGRFFPLRDDFSVDSPLRGTLQWATASSYRVLFRNDTLRIDVVMRDRAGNVSNTITFDEFTIEGVRRATEE